MALTMSSSQSLGAGRFGINAVVITMSIVASDFAEFGKLGVAEFFGLNRSIAAGSRAILLFFFKIQIDKFGAHRFDLFGHFRTHVKCIGDSTKRNRRTNCGQSGNTGANNENACWRHFTGSSDLTGEETTKIVTRFDYSAITGNVRHGGQSVHFLGTGNTCTISIAMTFEPAALAASMPSSLPAGLKNEISVLPLAR